MTRTLYSVAIVTLCSTLAEPASPKFAQGTTQANAGGMAFDQGAVAHHFLLKRTGGTIQVEVRDPSDEKTRGTVRAHLRRIAADFAKGDFGAPFATHGEMPPGVATLQRLKDAVTYTYVETATGGRVDIASADDAALAAIHQFLRYQITEHRTGDPMTVR